MKASYVTAGTLVKVKKERKTHISSEVESSNDMPSCVSYCWLINYVILSHPLDYIDKKVADDLFILFYLFF